LKHLFILINLGTWISFYKECIYIPYFSNDTFQMILFHKIIIVIIIYLHTQFLCVDKNISKNTKIKVLQLKNEKVSFAKYRFFLIKITFLRFKNIIYIVNGMSIL